MLSTPQQTCYLYDECHFSTFANNVVRDPPPYSASTQSQRMKERVRSGQPANSASPEPADDLEKELCSSICSKIDEDFDNYDGRFDQVCV